jgi:hypothetical protein
MLLEHPDQTLDQLVAELHAEDITRLEDILAKHADFHEYLRLAGHE